MSRIPGSIGQILGKPGVSALTSAGFGFVSADGKLTYKPGAGTIDGTVTRDVLNTPSQLTVRPGVILAKNASSGKYGNWSIGASTAALTGVATTLNASALTATELVRRVGASGTFVLTGPPTAGGTVAQTTVTYTSVNTSTGAITINATGVAHVSGSIISQVGWATPLTVVPGTVPLVLPGDGTDVEFPIPDGGRLISANLLPYPADTALRLWIMQQMSTLVGNKFSFDTMN